MEAGEGTTGVDPLSLFGLLVKEGDLEEAGEGLESRSLLTGLCGGGEVARWRFAGDEGVTGRGLDWFDTSVTLSRGG